MYNLVLQPRLFTFVPERIEVISDWENVVEIMYYYSFSLVREAASQSERGLFVPG